MGDRSRMDHLWHWGFPGQRVNGNPMLKSMTGGGWVQDSSVTGTERTATIMVNGASVERKASLAEGQAEASSMGFPRHPWAMIPVNMNSAQTPQQNLDIKVKEMHNVATLPSEEVDNGNGIDNDNGNGGNNIKPAKTRKPRATKKANNTAPKEAKPKQGKKKASNRESSTMPHEKSDKKNLDIVINGITYDISSIPVPICSCTGITHQCYRWGIGGWQSSCCTTSMSVYPLPLNNTRAGARIAGRKMSIGAYRKVLERTTAEGHDLSTPVDLKDHWAKHGTNKFVTIR